MPLLIVVESWSAYLKNCIAAAAQLTDILNNQLTSSPDSFIVATGDFNHTRLNSTQPFYQHVNLPTRNNVVLDLCYSNVKYSYKCITMPPLGQSDHDMVLLLPKYKTKLIENKTVEKCVSVWDQEGRERLADCLDCTDWNVFIDACEDLDELNDTVSSYINFCESNCIKKKIVKCFGNNKPWVTNEMKILLKEKRKAYYKQNRSEQNNVCKKVNNKIKECKRMYKEKLESKFNSGDSKGMWDGLKKIVGYKDKQIPISIDKGREQTYADDLNKFYCRFDSQDFTEDINKIKMDLLKDSDDCPFQIEQFVVLKSFLSLKPNKACGPDDIKPFVLKTFARELSGIYTYIFNMSIRLKRLPVLWKLSKIIPVPKSNNVKELNDLRPIALTSTLVKVLERIVMNNILPTCQPYLDPLQFAYRANRGVEDAILCFTQNLYKHIDSPKCYVRTLFIDFSSAFNTIQPHLLLPKLLNMNINKSICLWILDFLTQRPQFVFIKHKDKTLKSSMSIINTGVPQGTVLAPTLFTIYTNSCRSNIDNIPIIKYADDTSIQALIKNDQDLSNYFSCIHNFVEWCNNHFLKLNVKKTKEMIFDFRRLDNNHASINITNETVERVDSYKYLGVVFDEKLTWHNHTQKVQKKLNQRMYFLRKLNCFNVDIKLLSLFYKSCVISILSFCLTAWGGNAAKSDTKKINRCLKNASKMLNNNTDMFDDILLELCVNKLSKILSDTSHPLVLFITRSPRSGRILHLSSKTVRYFNSFLPFSIRHRDNPRLL